MRLVIEHHYPTTVTEELRRRGHDVITTLDRGWDQFTDEQLLEHCVAERRALMTNNVADFAVIVHNLLATGGHHYGIVYSSDAVLPRTRSMTGRFVERLEALLGAHRGEADLVDQIHWL